MWYEEIFKGIFDAEGAAVISVLDFILCVGVSLLLGLIITLGYVFKARYTRSFVITLSLLPAVVCVVIMMVNGNIGAGVAVAGAFSLVRFRSVPGTAKEIGMLFLAMSAGLIAGMGYLAFATLFTILLSGVFVLYNLFGFGAGKSADIYRTVRITIPEDLDYSEVFDDVMEQYTSACELIKVKTTNLGSLFRVTYNVTLKDASLEKVFIDKLRVKNGNLEISVSKQETGSQEL